MIDTSAASLQHLIYKIRLIQLQQGERDKDSLFRVFNKKITPKLSRGIFAGDIALLPLNYDI